MSRRFRWFVIIFAAVALAGGVAVCAGGYVVVRSVRHQLTSTPAALTLDALRAAGVPVASTATGPATAQRLGCAAITEHIIFTTPDGRRGHILVLNCGNAGGDAGAEGYARQVVADPFVAYWDAHGRFNQVVALEDPARWSQAERETVMRTIDKR